MTSKQIDRAYWFIFWGFMLGVLPIVFGALYLVLAPDPLRVTTPAGYSYGTLQGEPVDITIGGDPIGFKRSVCLDAPLDAPVVVERFLEQRGSLFLTLESKQYNAPLGCTELTFILSIPDIAPPNTPPTGLTYYRPVLNYKINPAISIRKDAPGIWLNIREKE